MEEFFKKYVQAIENTEPIKYTGSVTAVRGLMIESNGPRSAIGEICRIEIGAGQESVLAEVVGLENTSVKLMAYGETKGIEVGCTVVASGHTLEVPVGPQLLGRVLDALGNPCDGKGDITSGIYYPAIAKSPDPMLRSEISKRITTGVRAIDGVLPVGKGQRLGIFAGSGVGKSTLISMIARNTNADVNVIGLIGERGREVMEFIKRDLGEEGLKRSVLVIATGDQSAIARVRAAYVTTAIAEYFRDQGKDVMLMFDNISRFAKAQRDVGIESGQPPAKGSYPSIVYDSIQKLLERTGTNDKGSITAFYAVLVDGDDMDDPIADTVRGVLDGHVVLSRRLAGLQHYPAIDMMTSISRHSKRVSGPVTRQAVTKVRRWIATYHEQEDMIVTGAYRKGSMPDVDEAIEMHPLIEDFLCQDEYDKCPIEDTLKKLSELSGIEIPQEEYSENAASL